MPMFDTLVEGYAWGYSNEPKLEPVPELPKEDMKLPSVDRSMGAMLAGD